MTAVTTREQVVFALGCLAFWAAAIACGLLASHLGQ